MARSRGSRRIQSQGAVAPNASTCTDQPDFVAICREITTRDSDVRLSPNISAVLGVTAAVAGAAGQSSDSGPVTRHSEP